MAAMPVKSNYRTSVADLKRAVYHVRNLRRSARKFFQVITEGLRRDDDDDDDDGNEEQQQNNNSNNYAAIKARARACLVVVKNDLGDLDKSMKRLIPHTLPDIPQNMEALYFDPAPHDLPLYHQALHSDGYVDKLHVYSCMMLSVMRGNDLTRSSASKRESTERKAPINVLQSCPEGHVNFVLYTVNEMYRDMHLCIARQSGRNASVLVVLRNVLRAVVTLRGLIIEWVVVRGCDEPFFSGEDDGKVDMWTPSRYKVFQRITDNASAAMVSTFEPEHPQDSVVDFFIWLHSYAFLFNAVCKKCNCHLRNYLPPTWRDLRTLEPFHEECRR